MKLNLEKCALRVSSAKILSFLISNKGVEVNPAQIKAIEELPDVITRKKRSAEINRKNSSLGVIYFKIIGKEFNILSVLKKQNHFEWTDEYQQDLKDLKLYLSKLHLLTKPKNEERLLIYLVVSEVAVSAVLVREDKGK